MKVADNSLKSIKKHFNDALKDLFPATEINTFFQWSAEHVLNLSRKELSALPDKSLTESELLKFFSIVKRLKTEEPIQYILGETEFYGLKFNVNPSVLIPRPETEELVDWIIKDNKQNTALKMLDIGTGSGCIPVALKKHLSHAEVFAADISPEALKIAEKNAEINQTVIHFIQLNILPLGAADRLPDDLDIIVSNPPYVRKSEAELMQKNVLAFEPHLALFVEDDDALLFYRQIANIAGEKLRNKGLLYFEINEAFGKDVCELLKHLGFINIELKKDLSGKDRMVKAQLLK